MDEHTHTKTDAIAAVGALAEPTRRRLYEYIARRGGAVGRDEAARAVGVGRPLAAFHLDRLVESGLLVTEYRRMSGRSGPGAGRPAKLYRRADRGVDVSLPARRYELAAEVLATAIEARGVDEKTAVGQAARARGEALAATVWKAPCEGEAEITAACALRRALEAEGFEPALGDDGVVRLRNCPFHALLDEHRDLTCSMNRALLDGLASAIGGTGFEAAPSSVPGYCCVAFEPSRAAGG